MSAAAFAHVAQLCPQPAILSTVGRDIKSQEKEKGIHHEPILFFLLVEIWALKVITVKDLAHLLAGHAGSTFPIQDCEDIYQTSHEFKTKKAQRK